MDIFQARTQRNDIASLQDGLLAPARLGDAYGLCTMDTHGRYYDAVRRGRVFFVTNSAGQALSLNSTTATGIIVSNPLNSGVNLAILEVVFGITVAPTGASTLLLTGGTQNSAVTQTTTNVANGVLNAQIGGGLSSKTTVGSSATIATAVIQRVMGTFAATGSTSALTFKDDVGGALVVPPGFVISLQALTTAVTGVGQITWEECPI